MTLRHLGACGIEDCPHAHPLPDEREEARLYLPDRRRVDQGREMRLGNAGGGAVLRVVPTSGSGPASVGARLRVLVGSR